ncbi:MULTISPECIES: M6 family metalloprotease domain-containing protein [Bacillus cereus group]|uniref:M6 family metalloprotease domain-containing protein n=1 Tax=Bacillus cereus group TaxID=86661 RepID=UPI0012386BB0|nr:M6 family metalloprotease domain-containing protein [Bacillus cereus]KAA6458909.1 M6 family metalloprotease domain-containing protein [Bacillus cereus]KAB2412521.1 M6 family metalloprotease domain-containing protein [Bacillus cereus]KAB2435163.1 M6 family metalloprotease domain-containing protein [Bacillus cereus]KAB2461726.1 M6 family metalloprotease domain-containing protein [Bacillus cereus]
MKRFYSVPPSPKVTIYLLNEYQKNWEPQGFSFQQFLIARGYQNPAHNIHGMDDNWTGVVHNGEVELIDIPQTPVTGELNVMVLLVDFPDLQGTLTKDHYKDLLFSRNSYPTGSMADYYDEVSRGKVNIKGEVHGWLRMPQNYNYYTNGNSGLTDELGREHYPNDARKLAEHAVQEAISQGINFSSNLDVLQNGTITALFIVHAGEGAEKFSPPLSGNHIWSHKWVMKEPKKINPELEASTYLMVPQEALLGVCAHELGHLAFQWQDFYDSNRDEDRDFWDGNGMWDLMASGSYAGDELVPVHPTGLHKLQHGWIEVEEINESKTGIDLDPVTRPNGKILKIKGAGYEAHQYLILENRAKEKFDSHLPGEGLLVWRIDEHADQERGAAPGMLLIQADGRNDLRNPFDRNRGDAGDPFPGTTNKVNLSDAGPISTSFPGKLSGVSLKNISYNRETKQIRLDVIIEQ